MKAIFITYDQAHEEKIQDILTRNGARGFTQWNEIQGRGSKTGEPHYGTHAWPSVNGAIMTVVADEKVKLILEKLRALDESKLALGLRAFVMPVEDSL